MANEEAKESVETIEFEGGKKVTLRKMQIRDWETAAKAASRDTEDGNQFIFSMKMQQELVKMLIVSCEGKQLSGAQKESLDSFLEVGEYAALQEVIGKLMGKSKIIKQSSSRTSGGK